MSAVKVLQYTVVRENPATLRAEALLAGTKKSDLPDWAKELVQDDDFTTADADEKSDDGSSSVPGNDSGDKGYASRKVPELKEEIEKRNADREDDAKLSTDGNKGDLVATLEADDAATAAAAQS